MKILLYMLALALAQNAISRDVQVRGHFQKNGTYVAPHTRSAPDSNRWNNYGKPANPRQEQQYNRRDQDNDGILNQYDYDDDNDGTLDNYEK